jgi:hypothetical protein
MVINKNRALLSALTCSLRPSPFLHPRVSWVLSLLGLWSLLCFHPRSLFPSLAYQRLPLSYGLGFLVGALCPSVVLVVGQLSRNQRCFCTSLLNLHQLLLECLLWLEVYCLFGQFDVDCLDHHHWHFHWHVAVVVQLVPVLHYLELCSTLVV